MHRLGAKDVLFPLPGPTLVAPSPPILERGPWGPVSVHSNANWVSARDNCSNVH